MLLPSQPVVSEFFSHALCSGTLAHGYLFKGNQYEDMYAMALALAKVLNCTGSDEPDQACGQCQNCRWITQNAHPSVNTISRMSFLTDDDGNPPDFLSPEQANSLAKKDTYSKQIKAGQIERLLYQVGLHASDYRVIIFTDSEVLPASHAANVPAPFDWRNLDANEEKSFHIRPLSAGIFNAASANRFLKTLEEPPPKTIFLFITESEAHLLDTIVSRCQVIPFQRRGEEGVRLQAEHRQFFDQLMTRLDPRADFYQLQAQFEQFFTEEQSLSVLQALGLFQQYLRERLHQADVSPTAFARYRTLQQKLEHAQNLLNAKTHPQQTVNNLFLELATTGGF